MRFNAWAGPWIPVQDAEGRALTVSLRELLGQGPDLASLGPGLEPLDLDSLYRFLPSIFAVAYRYVREEDRDGTYRIPDYALDAIEDSFGERFELFGERPFLQRWDKTYDDLLAAIPPKKALLDVIKPIEQLPQHAPGGSSSLWAVRRDSRVPTEPAHVTMLLVTAWFQTKNGNGSDPWKGKVLKGSAGTWHTNPLAVHLTDRRNLARTLAANTPLAWTERDDLPLFLDHDGLPEDFGTAAKESVTRCTYAKTLPLLVAVEGEVVGFILGADDTVPVPLLAADAKTSLGEVHAHDHTRLYVETIAGSRSEAKTVTVKPRGSFGSRLSSTEGFERWFRADYGISKALATWWILPRVHKVADRDKGAWCFSVLSETTDGKGSRTWAAWDEMPLPFADARGDVLAHIQDLLKFANQCRGTFVSCARTATGDGRTPPLAVVGQAAFYSAILPVIADLAHDATQGNLDSMATYARRVADLAVREFDVATHPILTPARVADVAKARGDFRRLTYRTLKKNYPMQESA